MKERPILYSTPMTQAKLAGRKTQTRRIMRVQLSCDHSGYVEADWKDKPIQWSEIGLKHGKAYCSCCGNGVELSKDWSGLNCPYGKPGDILWARETLIQNGELGLEYFADREAIDESLIPIDYGPYGGTYSFRNIPNIHMPKWAARIWERITDIRVERLQDISEEDAIAEGIERTATIIDTEYYANYGDEDIGTSLHPIESYRTLWQSINGPDSWELSPWVWVIETETLSLNGRPKNL